MTGYKTSKDYKQLKELLDSGYEVIVVFPLNDIEERIYIAWKHPAGVYYLGDDRKYDSRLSAHQRFSFVEECKAYNIEFIEPTEE